MRNNTRRNRNIGTSKQGYGRDGCFTIPQPFYNSDWRTSFERLGQYTKCSHLINGHEFIFIVEETYEDFYHACTVDDVAGILKEIPIEDYGELKFIIFRQPKRKEKTLSPAWGRLVYSYEFEKEDASAIILEATQKDSILKWGKRLSVEMQKELTRLRADGHIFTDEKRYFQTILTPEAVRCTQLYRTLLHEIGHYVHYMQIVERPELQVDGQPDKTLEEWERKWSFYFDSIPQIEKEKFAHVYADRMRERFKNRQS